jgi:nucleoside-diphosphate-sugar epimerase
VLVAGSSSQYEPHLNPYAASKNIIEYIPHPDVCFMRFHTVYGPSPRKNMFFDKLLNNTLEYVTEHERDFIHIDDMVRAIEILIRSKFTGSIDIGTGTSVKISDIRPDLPIKTKTLGEREKTQADIEPMKLLGFVAKISVESFLKSYQ